MREPTKAEIRVELARLEVMAQTATALDCIAIERAIERLREWAEGAK